MIRTPRGSPRAFWLSMATAVATVAAVPSLAQTDPQAPVPSAVDARAEAEAAREAAAEARARVEAARRELEEATRRAQRAVREAEAAEAAAEAEAEREREREAAAAAAEAEPAPPSEVEEALRGAEEARERAQEAERRAEAAEVKAERALAKVERLERRFAYDRPGLFLGAAVYWAPEDFEVRGDVRVDETAGAMARLGYRVHPRLAVDVRFDYLDDFDLEDAGTEWELDAYAITANFRVFLLTGRFQPWLGLGGGAMRSDLEGRDLATGAEVETAGRETDATLRFAGGLDFYLTPHLALSLEAAYQTVGGVRSYVEYGQLGGGLDFRF